jgi:glycosyltransferase involved in cell wall biosynthesis
LLGFGFALAEAHNFEKPARRPHLCHGVWATAPTAAAWMIERLTGIPYTMGAHAYDVFQHGGDWLLEEKLRRARLIHTTTSATRARLLVRGADPARIALIRRGLDNIPPLPEHRAPEKTLHLLAIGRLIPKKGYFHLLRILCHLRECGIPYECRIIGGGPLAGELQTRIEELRLHGCVQLPGRLDYTAVAAQRREWADVFLFTGTVAPDGDRDGLPNVIPEAMADGVPIVTSPVAGTTEAITDGKTGLVVPLENLDAWRDAILRLTDDREFVEKIRGRAHAWVVENFDAKRNTAQLAQTIHHAVVKV